MAYDTRRGRNAASGRMPQFLIASLSAVVAVTGIWLWWVDQGSLDVESLSDSSFTDGASIQTWTRRLHVAASVVIAVLVAALIVRALRTADRWRLLFLMLFLGFFGIGIWSGYAADWGAARLWVLTVGSHVSAFVSLDPDVPFPDDLLRVRLHLAFIPVALAFVAVASRWHYRGFR